MQERFRIPGFLAFHARWAAWGAALLVILLGMPSVQAQASDLWGVDNSVFALARIGDTLYVGGAFSRAGPSTGGAVVLGRAGGQARKFPSVAGYVYSMAADGHGGWFISGNFTAVGGVPRYCLAHVLSDGSVAPWNPNPNYVSYGTGGLLVSGKTVYVSGGFATIAGASRQYLAALDADTGQALDFDAHLNGLASPIAVRDSVLFVGGRFSEIGGQPRNNIAALDAATGDATSWDPDAGGTVGSPTADGGVWAMLLADTTAFVGGSFSQIGGQNRSMLAELDLKTGNATGWNPNVQGPGTPYPFVSGLQIEGSRLYLAGSFSSVSGRARQSLAAFDLDTDSLLDLDVHAASTSDLPEIYAMRVDGASIFVGGWFQSMGGKPRNCVAEIDATTGVASSWNPSPSSVVYTIGVADSAVGLGGTFRSLGMVPRHNLAAFDLRTGQVTDWNPNPDGLIVYTMAANDGKLYVGGDFGQIGGEARNDLAALDPVTGVPNAFAPNPDQVVRTLVSRKDTLYAGGAFSQIGGQSRRFLAALDGTTGVALDWNPDPNDGVLALVLQDQTLYAGGWFSQIGGQAHRSLAAVNATTGVVLPWQLDTDGIVETLAANRSTVFAGGEFDQVIGGPPRVNLLAFDASTGAVRDWAPSPNGPREDAYHATVYALATRGDTVYVGGDFTTIAGGQKAALAAVSGVTGELIDWGPNPDQSVHALEVSGTELYAGGYFQAAEWVPHLALMRVPYPRGPAPPDSTPIGPTVAFAPIRPNPIQSAATLWYSLPTASTVSLAVYDLQGRRVETILDKQLQAAGVHQIGARVDRLKAGCYFISLQAGGVTRTQKAVVLR